MSDLVASLVLLDGRVAVWAGPGVAAHIVLAGEHGGHGLQLPPPVLTLQEHPLLPAARRVLTSTHVRLLLCPEDLIGSFVL